MPKLFKKCWSTKVFLEIRKINGYKAAETDGMIRPEKSIELYFWHYLFNLKCL
ncbi:hypothetical protein SAMN04488057_116108 [Cyclobacterium lianum]|uniref:Uncharacterized protein n=1 Tax=Cyclobacterium lianum TaxID=388280 RepID=A0A1M7QD74_9BACT|nr:hypothetical protein SAMN04488057_116108 [Cyclobacterium lianum]